MKSALDGLVVNDSSAKMVHHRKVENGTLKRTKERLHNQVYLSLPLLSVCRGGVHSWLGHRSGIDIQW